MTACRKNSNSNEVTPEGVVAEAALSSQGRHFRHRVQVDCSQTDYRAHPPRSRLHAHVNGMFHASRSGNPHWFALRPPSSSDSVCRFEFIGATTLHQRLVRRLADRRALAGRWWHGARRRGRSSGRPSLIVLSLRRGRRSREHYGSWDLIRGLRFSWRPNPSGPERNVFRP